MLSRQRDGLCIIIARYYFHVSHDQPMSFHRYLQSQTVSLISPNKPTEYVSLHNTISTSYYYYAIWSVDPTF